MNYYDNNSSHYTTGAGVDNAVSQVMKRVYVKMFLGLLVTALVSLWGASSYGFLSFMATHTWAMWALLGVELLIVLGISGAVNRLSSSVASALFYLFALIMGLSLAPIFLLYTSVSIAKTFFITAGTFGAMSIYGYVTKQDLSRWGSILFMALIGLIICSVVNIFWANSTFEWIISGAGVLIFVGLTAWDTQQVKNMALMAPADSYGRLATIGALTLYLDFINLFLYLLRFFGNRNS